MSSATQSKLHPNLADSWRLRALASVAAVCLVGISAGAASAANIMPIGNSITQGVLGQCSYRAPLTRSLVNNPSCDAEFVGPQYGAQPICDLDGFHYAFAGIKADYFPENVGTWTGNAVYATDYALLHIGSNDINQGESVSSTIDDIDDTITAIFDSRPGIKVLLANLIPWDPTPSANYTESVPDNPNVDELALTTQLGDAIEVLAANLISQGKDVILVDVRTGFNNQTMTIDGVHPNDVGERLMAEQFRLALEADGACPTFTVPTLTMEEGEWYQISIPADAGVNNTPQGIFSDDLGQYGSDWSMLGYDPSVSSGYVTPGLNEQLEFGVGYWIKHINDEGESRTVDMPADVFPTQLTGSGPCSSNRGCFSVPLKTNLPVQTNSGPARWNIIGFPFNESRTLAAQRVQTDTGACANGCSPTEAFANDVMFSTIFRWDPTLTTSNKYRQVNGSDLLDPWFAGWVPVLPGAFGDNPQWLVTPD